MQRNANMLTRRTVLAASAVAAIGAVRSRAQTLKKTVHIVVGFPAGGATDLIARILADRLRGRYAAAVIVENKPGGAAAGRGRLRQERGTGRERISVHARFSDHRLSAQLPHPELRSVARPHPGCSGVAVHFDIRDRPRSAGRDQVAGGIRCLVQGQSR